MNEPDPKLFIYLFIYLFMYLFIIIIDYFFLGGGWGGVGWDRYNEQWSTGKR